MIFRAFICLVCVAIALMGATILVIGIGSATVGERALAGTAIFAGLGIVILLAWELWVVREQIRGEEGGEL